MAEVVLDSSVIVKSVLRPDCWLPEEVYKRELVMHHKAKVLVKNTEIAWRDGGHTVSCPS